MADMRGGQENVTVREVLDERPAVSGVTGVRCQLQQRTNLDSDLYEDSEAAVRVRELCRQLLKSKLYKLLCRNSD